MEYKLAMSGCCMKSKGCSGLKIKKLNTFDWLCDLPQAQDLTDWVEVQFKNTRKGYFLNSTKIPLEKGDMVAVESSPGHDIGEVTLTGALVLKQMKKVNFRYESHEVKRVYRKARPVDLEKFEEAKGLEHDTMLRSRKIAEDLRLNMKIGDVEYQGDGNKAIFYYIADDRVDFRQLIKVLAETFKVRIEMKQIGARQEAGRIGGVGPCGRELCCSSWMTNFVSVSTSAARYQDLSLNPQKLAGQCAKLKCCLNYETDVYAEALREIPGKDIVLETKDASYFLFKSDILKRQLLYSTSKDFLANAVTISAERAKQIIALNRKGIRVDDLSDVVEAPAPKSEFGDILGQDELNRFDKSRKPGKNRRKDRNRGNRSDRQESEERFRTEDTGVPSKQTSPKPSASISTRPSTQNESGKRPDNRPGEPNNRNQANKGNRQARPGNSPRNQGGDKEHRNHPGQGKSRFEKPQKNNSEGKSDA